MMSITKIRSDFRFATSTTMHNAQFDWRKEINLLCLFLLYYVSFASKIKVSCALLLFAVHYL